MYKRHSRIIYIYNYIWGHEPFTDRLVLFQSGIPIVSHRNPYHPGGVAGENKTHENTMFKELAPPEFPGVFRAEFHDCVARVTCGCNASIYLL